MYVDLFCKDGYLFVNKKIIKLFGIVEGVYLSELFNILNKVAKKKSYDPQTGYFKVDRNYIESITTIDPAAQRKIDEKMCRRAIISISPDNPDQISLDTELFVSIVVEEDEQALRQVSNKLSAKKTSKEDAQAKKKEGMKAGMSQYIRETDPDLVEALTAWISSCVDEKSLTKVAVERFQDKLNAFSTQKEVKLEVIGIAAAKAYNLAEYAIDIYTKSRNLFSNTTTTAMPQQKVSTELSDTTF